MSSAGIFAAALLAALRFSIPEGGTLNEFYRDGPVAAHLVLRSGPSPRLVVAFPAGNSGAAIWFEAEDKPLVWRRVESIRSETRRLPDGGTLRGMTAEITASPASVAIRESLLGSVRVLREFDDGGAVPPGTGAVPKVTDTSAVWQRRRLDGAAGYYLSITVTEGTLVQDGKAALRITPAQDGRLRIRVTALTGDEPLTPIDEDRLLTGSAAPDAQLRRTLAFLSYREKLLAGSWRFNTYFGRDTLMSLRLLAPVLGPEVAAAGLASVLKRLNSSGEVAHEEDIGEFAVLRRVRGGEPPGGGPLFDYKMIDDDFMLPVVAAHHLLETSQGRERASSFLARESGAGAKHGSALVRNLRYVVAAASPFARDPDWRNLIGLKPGVKAGNWRDSDDGLGGGRYPYDVNGVLVPAALEAIARLTASGLLSPYLDEESTGILGTAETMAPVWRREAPRFFEVEVTPAAAAASVAAYARHVDVDASATTAGIGSKPLRFHGVALDGSGRPVPVINSDEAFALLFLDVAPTEAERVASTLTRAFPAGLLTDVGLLVANPAFAPAEIWPAFDRNRYHGTVIWSWHHALLRAALDRQLARDDLPPETRAAIESSRRRLVDAMREAQELRGSELWSWSQSGGEYRIEPFGQAKGHQTESNAAQLWSAVHLAWP